MRYQLRIFQLILVVFLTGCTSGMKEDYVVTATLKKKKLKQKTIKKIIIIYMIFPIKIIGIFLIILC
jgi:hypothetical protein